MLASLSFQQISFFIILLAALFLFFTKWVRNDLVAIFIIVALYATRILSSEEALSGFSSEPALVVAGIFVLSGALHATGVTDSFASIIGRVAGRGYSVITAVLMASVSVLSAFSHHVTTTAIMVPVTLTIAKQSQIAPSKLLMPISFAASLGTTLAIIGAPAFLLASAVLQTFGRPPLGVFSIAPIGVALCITAIIFVLTIGRYLLPDRAGNSGDSEYFRLDEYLTEVVIPESSPFIGKTIDEFEKDKRYSLQVLGRMRNGRRRRRNSRPLRAGDVLLVRAPADDLVAIRNDRDVELNAVQQYGMSTMHAPEEQDDGAERGQFVQAIVAPHSDLIGRSIGDVDVRERYGTVIVGLWRKTGWLNEELSKILLQAGDILVFEGEADAIERMGRDNAFLLLVPFHGAPKLKMRAQLATAIMAVSIGCAAFNLVALEIAALAGAAMMVLTGCISPRKAYDSIDAKIFVFIAGAIPLGLAMEKTGLSTMMANGLKELVVGWNPFFILVVVFTCVALITQVMSDAATTALFAPIACSLAIGLNHNPEPYVITVAMAAVTACLTPLGHHGNMLVYSPGGYKFYDFIRVGAPLTICIGLIVCTITPLVWPY